MSAHGVIPVQRTHESVPPGESRGGAAPRGRLSRPRAVARETGAALTGIELGAAEGLPGLLARIEASPLRIQHVAPGTTAYRFLV